MPTHAAVRVVWPASELSILLSSRSLMLMSMEVGAKAQPAAKPDGVVLSGQPTDHRHAREERQRRAEDGHDEGLAPHLRNLVEVDVHAGLEDHERHADVADGCPEIDVAYLPALHRSHGTSSQP